MTGSKVSTYRATAGGDAAALALIASSWGVMTLQVLSFDDVGTRVELTVGTSELSLPLTAIVIGAAALSVALLRTWGQSTTTRITYSFVLVELLCLSYAGWVISRRSNGSISQDLVAATAVTLCLLLVTAVRRGLGTPPAASNSGAHVHTGLLSPLVAFLVLTATSYAVMVSQEGSGRVIGAVCMVAVFLVSSTHVFITSSTLSVSLTPLLWISRRFNLDEIQVEAVPGIEPLAFWGWGIRGTRRRRAIVLRRGEGLEIRASKERLIVTVSDAGDAAGRVRGLKSTAVTPVGPTDPKG